MSPVINVLVAWTSGLVLGACTVLVIWVRSLDRG